MTCASITPGLLKAAVHIVVNQPSELDLNLIVLQPDTIRKVEVIMNFYNMIIWLCPFAMILTAFFTSGIQRFKSHRYGIYFIILLAAFLLDLQSLSFFYDKVDFIFSEAVLLILADFFWRGIRMKNKILKIGAFIIGMSLFMANYHHWIFGGPGRVGRHFDTAVGTHSAASHSGYHVKKRGMLTEKAVCMELYRKKYFSLFEQKLNDYAIPQAYENAEFTFKWHIFDQRIAVDIIGNNDTLWTLTDPGPPK